METMVVMALLAALTLMAAPTWSDYLERQNLKAAAENVKGHLHWLRSEAIQRNKSVFIRFVPGTSWCYGMSEDGSGACHCALSPQNCTVGGVVRKTSGDEFTKTRLTSTTLIGDQSGFEPTRGLALSAGTILLQSSSGHNVTIELNPAGRIKACSSTLPPYSPC
ncbi:MAG: GspH/FimT family pseudopilin [Magnetococcales bacterium]|nr:GspH/FimT family pseudopilin [Magnetococcales bacterium]